MLSVSSTKFLIMRQVAAATLLLSCTIAPSKSSASTQVPKMSTNTTTYLHAQEVRFGPQSVSCSMLTKTSVCRDGHVDFGVINNGYYPGIDCTTVDFLADIAFLGLDAVDDWEEACSLMPLSDQGLPKPLRTFEVNVEVIECEIRPDMTVTLADWSEVARVGKDHTLAKCHSVVLRTRESYFKCTTDVTAGVCSNGQIDPAVFNIVARPDCQAQVIRDLLVHGGQHTLTDWITSCAIEGGEHSLMYSDDCPGINIVRKRHYLEMNKNQCTESFHLHYQGIRGLTFNQRVSTFDAMDCQSTMCTVSTALSCWPSPRFNNGVAWGTMTVDVYTCFSTDYNLHVSGNFRGTIYMAGRITYAGAGGCVATSADGIIKISSPVLSWCDIRIDGFAGDTTVDESTTALRNVC